jgi:hypothetical protein
MEPVVTQEARPAGAKGSNSPAGKGSKGSAKGKGRGAPKGSSKGSYYSSFAEPKGNSQGSYYAQPQKGKGGKSNSKPLTYYRARGYLHLLYHHNIFPDFEFEIHLMQVELGATLKGYAN